MNKERTLSVSASFALLLCLVGVAPCFAQQERGRTLPRVWVLATGGTIAGTGASSTDLSNYRSGTVLGEDLVRAVPEIRKHADVKVEQIVNIASYDMTLDNWMTLAKRINQIVTDDPTVGLLLPPMVWGTQFKYTNDAMLMVLASRRYEPEDYIRDYDQFLVERAALERTPP